MGRMISPSGERSRKTEEGIRPEVVRLAKLKLAMGLYDDPKIFEMALDRMCDTYND